MQRLEVSCAVRPIYGSLGAKGLKREPSSNHRTPVVNLHAVVIRQISMSARNQTLNQKINIHFIHLTASTMFWFRYAIFPQQILQIALTSIMIHHLDIPL
jgi:hypothetical protein